MQTVLKKEQAILEKSQYIIAQQNYSHEELKDEYSQLFEAYQQLLSQSSDIQKISDLNEIKLFDANLELGKQKEKLHELTITDYLTGSYNRRYILEILDSEFIKSRRYALDLSCILLDIDNFKNINERYGHKVGDFTLKTISDMIQETIREVDIFGRFSGEEFLIILPSTKVYDANIAAEKLRKKIAQLKFDTGHEEIGSFMLTVSMGVADVHLTVLKTVEELLHQTEKLLIQAKNNNENQYDIYS